MKRFKQQVLAVSAALFLVAAPSVHSWAATLQEQRDDYKSKAEEAKQKADEAAGRVDSISEQIHQIQSQVESADADYKSVMGQRDDKQAAIDKEEVLLADTQKEYDAKSKVLDKRVRDIYINGQISYIDVLFGAKDFSDFMTRMDLLKRIIKYDYDLVSKVQKDKATIENTKASLEKDKEALDQLVQDAEAKKSVLEAKQQEQQELLDKATNDKETSEQAYEEFMAASKQIESMILQRQSGGSSSVSGSGAMIWPISGPVTSEFGWRTHPIFGTARFHSGIDIGGDYGMPVHAAASGKIIYAGWISGYGNAVIIDHGGGITTLYGHNQSLAVGVGQSVSQGQVIAYCGSTGNSTGPHCHFEVRHNGSPVSPYGYL